MIRLGMIGCGNMARGYLLQLGELADIVRVTALVDLVRERAEKAATDAPIARGARIETDYDKVIDDVDAVVIALPHDLHHPVAMTFLEADKHVLLEKPMAITEQECLDLVRTSDHSNGILMIGYVMRFHPLWLEMARLLHEQAYGDVFHISIWTEQYTNFPYSHWAPQVVRLGGGQLFSHGCHYIDLLLSWLGRPVSGFHLGTNHGTPWMVREGTSNVAIKFENGAVGYHFGTWGARGTKLAYSVHAHCTEGMLELNHADRTISLWRNPGKGDLPALEASLPPGAELEAPNRALIYRLDTTRAKSISEEVRHFIQCIQTNSQPVTNPRMATQSLRVIWRLYQAEENGVVADLRGLGLDQFSESPDPILRGYASTKEPIVP